jgi:hypothetical protein
MINQEKKILIILLQWMITCILGHTNIARGMDFFGWRDLCYVLKGSELTFHGQLGSRVTR